MPSEYHIQKNFPKSFLTLETDFGALVISISRYVKAGGTEDELKEKVEAEVEKADNMGSEEEDDDEGEDDDESDEDEDDDMEE